MILSLLVATIIVALFFVYAHYKKTAVAVSLIAFLMIVLIGQGKMTDWFLDPLQNYTDSTKEISWSDKNAIILLGAGLVEKRDHQFMPSIIAFSRIFKTAELYHACKKTKNVCTIIVTGGSIISDGPSEAAVYKDALLNVDIPSHDIIVEAKSLNTFQNAKYTSEILKQFNFNHYYLVTSAFHEKRSLLYFKHFIHLPFVAAPSDRLKVNQSLLLTGYNFAIADFVLNEYLGILRYHLYQTLGFNKK